MTTRISGRRRRTAVSVSVPVPVNASDSVDQLDRIVEIFHQVNRTLPKTVLGDEELIALGGLITQINGALLTLTELLSAPTHHYDRTRLLRADAGAAPPQRPPSAASLLRDCREGYLAVYTSARMFHADLRQHPRAGPGAASS